MPVATARIPRIHVLAGVNGAGKSSVGGEEIRARGAQYYNPDEVARQAMKSYPHINQSQANGVAWQNGKLMLERAIREKKDFAFETTLGANTMTELLIQAAEVGFEIHIWYAGLASPEQHIARVRARVKRGGHDIPEQDIRRRFDHSRLNLIRLMPHLTSLRVFDNSLDADPEVGNQPVPQIILRVEQGAVITDARDLVSTPEWARPLVAAALRQKR